MTTFLIAVAVSATLTAVQRLVPVVKAARERMRTDAEEIAAMRDEAIQRVRHEARRRASAGAIG